MSAEFEALFTQAYAAGKAAGNAAQPPMMVVVEADVFGRLLPEGQRYEVPEGPCGFAWVNLRPGTSAFARWLVKNGKAHKAYEGGVNLWISDFGQSLVRKEACAAAMACVFCDAGLKAYSQSRMD